jgi:hypothetical protein
VAPRADSRRPLTSESSGVLTCGPWIKHQQHSGGGREDEAHLLCLVYIDGLASWLNYPNRESARNCCYTLSRYGGNQQFALILPYWLYRALPWGNAPSSELHVIQEAVSALPQNEALTEPQLLDVLATKLSPAGHKWIAREAWRGSIAHAIYKALRCAGVHHLVGNHGLTFSARFGSEEVERIDFEQLHGALVYIARHAKAVSMDTNRWFGVE